MKATYPNFSTTLVNASISKMLWDNLKKIRMVWSFRAALSMDSLII